MPLLLMPSPLAVQPQYPPRINWNHPLARGLVIALVGSDGSLLTTWHNAADPQNNATPSTGIPGKDIALFGLSGKNTEGASTFHPAFAFAKASIDTGQNTSGFVLLKRNQSGENNIAGATSFSDKWYISSAGKLRVHTASGDRVTGATTLSIGNSYALGYTADVSNAYVVYVGGINDGSGAGGFGSLGTFDRLCGGANAGQSQDSLALVLQWNNRVLTAAEHQSLANAPWQIFAPRPARMWFAGAGAAAVEMFGQQCL